MTFSDTIPKDEFMMLKAIAVPSLIFLYAALMWASSARSETPDADKASSHQGLTLENIGRGIKSAAKNIEKEIPKVGPAIGDAFKKATGGKEKDQPKPVTLHSDKPQK